ncbi:MAG: hypothetical protein IT584_01055 [Chlamydiae bacterium]|nr:hypothetical protein [Chlamydiota bacterium]
MTPLWDDLATLLKQPEIQALSIRHSDLIMGHIENRSRTSDLIKLLETLLEERAFECLKHRIEESGDDLETLVDEIKNNKPKEKIVNDMFSLWNQNEDYFKSRTLKLNHGGSDTNIQEPIVACERVENIWHFQFDDPYRTHLEVRRDQTILVTQCHSYRLGHCLKTGLLSQGSQVLLEHGEKGSILPPEGAYAFSLKSVEGREGQVAVYLDKLIDPGAGSVYVLTCTQHRERGDIVKVELSQNGVVSDLPIDLFYRVQLTREDKKIIVLDDPVRQFIFDEAGPANTERQKLFQMKAIQEELERLQHQLSSDPALLDQLLDNYFQSQCNAVDLSLVPQGWHEQLGDISHRYSQYINQSRSVSDLVIQLVLEANYARLVPRRQSMQARYIMELLRKSQKYTRELQGKDITLFIGNTGAGKSTLIAYLLGAKLKPKQNLGGEECFAVEEDSDRYPVIGQGLGTSQTIFAQGFPIAGGSSTVFCDPPGFNDTRGEEHVLCANLTVDQAVSQARSIRAIVLTIPVQAFQLDRGGPVVSLVEKVRERFPDVMQPHKIDKVAQYVVLTKSGHVQPSIAEAVENGKRFEVLRDEIQQEIHRESGKEAPNMLRIHGLERQKGIWQSFLSLKDREAVDMPNLQNKRTQRRDGLVKKYTDPNRGFAKRRYISAMDTPEMKRRFGETLELSTASWRGVIFEKYLVQLPQKIAKYEADILEAKREIERLDQEFSLASGEIEDLGKKKQELEKISAHGMALTKEVLDRLTVLKSSRLDELKFNIQLKRDKIKSLNTLVGQVELRLDQKRGEIQIRFESIKANEVNIEKLSTSPHKESLFKNDYRGRREMTLSHWKSLEERKKCHDDLDENTAAYQTGKTEVVDCSKYKGTLYQVLQISRDYRIVPQAKDERANFEKSLSGGEYRAEHQGADYTIDLGAKPSATGTKVSYGYQTHWHGGDRRPWVEVSHTIPGYDYYNATIITLRGANDAEKQAITAANAEIVRLKREIETHQKEILLQEEAIRRDEGEMATLNKEMQESLVRDIIAEQLTAIAEKKKRQEWILERIETLHQDVNETRSQIQFAEKEKRHFAVLIRSEWETAKVLRELSEMVMSRGENGELMVQENSLNECSQFIKVFDEKGKEIREKVWKELNLVA